MKRFGAFLLTTLTLTLPTACTNESEVDFETPVYVTVDSLDGAKVTITKHQPLVVPVGENLDADAWTEGSVDNETVATFAPGPSFHAVGVGTTSAQLTNPDTGEVYTFTLVAK